MIYDYSQSNVAKKVFLNFFMVLTAVFSIFLYASCNLPILETGTIHLTIQSEVGRTILPDISMEIDHYQITGTGPSGAEFVLSDLTSETQQITNLIEGDWVLHIKGFNINNQLIAEGSTTLYVYAFTTNTAESLLLPVTGTGTLDISVTWDETIYMNVTIEVTLINQSNESTSLTMFITGNTATYNGSLDSGYYTLNSKLLDYGVDKWGRNEALRVISNSTSQVSYDILQ